MTATFLNPLDIGGTPSNYQQPNTANPANANVANFPTGANVLNVSEPVAVYQQPGAGAKDPYPTVTGLTGPMGTSKNPQ